jgi:hypothetical protein
MQSAGYRWAAVWLALCGAAYPAPAQQPAASGGQSAPPAAAKLTGFPWQNETLHYTVSYQSGLSIGDVTFTASKSGSGWNFEVTASAGVPGFSISDKYRSSTAAAPDLCSASLERETNHGSKSGREKTTVDQKAGSGERVTIVPDGGGKSTFSIGTCARDAIAYAYFAREELGQGRVPPSAQTYFGSTYSVSTTYTGSQDITVGGKRATTDHVNVSVKGPKSDFHFEVFYARDAARTPLEISVPLSLGTFTLDLVRP